MRRKQTKTCKYCGMGGFTWSRDGQGRWRLVDTAGVLHECLTRPKDGQDGPATDQATQPPPQGLQWASQHFAVGDFVRCDTGIDGPALVLAVDDRHVRLTVASVQDPGVVATVDANSTFICSAAGTPLETWGDRLPFVQWNGPY